ncbi:IS110 family transposase, partial [Glutamicibacter arilaitensis]|uniref:IS110 family transposase n=1 Tax=Glutamicibacter arilaitensis TaxID=256701 RepID=UPI003FD2E05E
MEIVHERAAGIDISKRDAKVAVRKPGQRRGTYRTEVKTFGATTAQIRELIGYLNAEKVSVIVMEATSDYWKPFYFLMEEEQLPVILVNAKRARNIPGRKTDVNDATWLAELAAHNLLAASFIPPEPIRHLRDLTRARSAVVHDRTKVYQRLEKFLESSGIKLSSVASSLTGVSSRHMLDALVAGERDPQVLADLSIRSMRRKIPELVEALEGRFTEHHAAMVKLHLHHIDTLDEQLRVLDQMITEAMIPFDQACKALETVPGIGKQTAQVIIAEVGVDM